MNNDELNSIFDRQASEYDKHQEKFSPIIKGLYFMLESVLAELPENAHILCVGPGTGAELLHLAAKFPGWTFTAVEPSGNMLEVCRQNAEEKGVVSRCRFHHGYLESLPDLGEYDAATCFMVSQFIMDPEARSAFFRSIASRLIPGGILASADLTANRESHEFMALSRVWVNMLRQSAVPTETIERNLAAWDRDVAILSAGTLESIIEAGGFKAPTVFFQGGLIRAWFSERV